MQLASFTDDKEGIAERASQGNDKDKYWIRIDNTKRQAVSFQCCLCWPRRSCGVDDCVKGKVDTDSLDS